MNLAWVGARVDFIDTFDIDLSVDGSSARRKPFIKWQGGKRRELPHIREFIPSDIAILAEPFCGGAAYGISLADFNRMKLSLLTTFNNCSKI